MADRESRPVGDMAKQIVKSYGFARLQRYLDNDHELARAIYGCCLQFLQKKPCDRDLLEYYCKLAYEGRAKYERDRRRNEHRCDEPNEALDVLSFRRERYEPASCESIRPQLLRIIKDNKHRSLMQYWMKHGMRKSSSDVARRDHSSTSNVSLKIDRCLGRTLAAMPFEIDHCADGIELLFGSAFAELRPYRAEVLQYFDLKSRELRRLHCPGSSRIAQLDNHFESIWERANAVTIEVFSEAERPCADYRMGLASLALLMSSRWLGVKHREQFRSARAEWELRGLFACKQMRRQLAAIGGYCGEPSLQFDLLREDDSTDIELAAAAAFISRRLFGRLGMSALVGSRPETMIKAISANNNSAFSGIVGYVNRYLHQGPRHLPSTTQMMLRWAQGAMRHYAGLETSQLVELGNSLQKYRDITGRVDDVEREWATTMAIWRKATA